MNFKLPAVFAVSMLIGASIVRADIALITISGATNPLLDGQWRVSTETGTFSSMREILYTQPWWLDAPDAALFATQVGNRITTSNILLSGEPLFAFNELDLGPYPQMQAWVWDNFTYPTSGGGVFYVQPGGPQSFAWAIGARVYSVAEPGTLGLLGIGLAGILLATRTRGKSDENA